MKCEYERSHPWLTFNHLADFDPALWMQIGEVHSKSEHIAGTPLQPRVQEMLYRVYLSKGAHATTQIEGNTLSEEEVAQLVEHQLKLPPSQEYLAQEVQNVLDCFALVIDEVSEGKSLTLTPERIKEFNAVVLTDLDVADHVVPGEYRTTSVTVGGGIYRGAPAEDCRLLVDKLCDWLIQLEQPYLEAPPEQLFAARLVGAILAHLYLAWIHPFGDGNGRTARLVEFQLLNRARVPAVAAHLLSDHYNRTRTRYMQVLAEASRKQPYDIRPFVRYAVQGLVDGMRQQISMIRGQQMSVTWANFIHARFQDETGPIAKRRREVVLALPPGRWTPVAHIRTLTPSITGAYHGIHQRTVTRDLKELSDMGLIRRSPEGVQPAVDQLQSFMPLRTPDPAAS